MIGKGCDHRKYVEKENQKHGKSGAGAVQKYLCSGAVLIHKEQDVCDQDETGSKNQQPGNERLNEIFLKSLKK